MQYSLFMSNPEGEVHLNDYTCTRDEIIKEAVDFRDIVVSQELYHRLPIIVKISGKDEPLMKFY